MRILTVAQATAIYEQLREANPHLPDPRHLPVNQSLQIDITPDGFTVITLRVMLDGGLPDAWTQAGHGE